MKLRDYSAVSKWLLFTLVFVAIGSILVQLCTAGEKPKTAAKPLAGFASWVGYFPADSR